MSGRETEDLLRAEVERLEGLLAAVTPFTALAALLDAPGWQASTPTIEEIDAHAEAFQFGTDDGEPDGDPDAPKLGGLWATRDAGGVAVVELYSGRHREPWVGFPGPAEVCRMDCGELRAWCDDGRIEGWLRLTANGRPVTR